LFIFPFAKEFRRAQCTEFQFFFQRIGLSSDERCRLRERSWYVGIEQIRNNLRGTEEPSRD